MPTLVVKKTDSEKEINFFLDTLGILKGGGPAKKRTTFPRLVTHLLLRMAWEFFYFRISLVSPLVFLLWWICFKRKHYPYVGRKTSLIYHKWDATRKIHTELLMSLKFAPAVHKLVWESPASTQHSGKSCRGEVESWAWLGWKRKREPEQEGASRMGCMACAKAWRWVDGEHSLNWRAEGGYLRNSLPQTLSFMLGLTLLGWGVQLF